MAIYLIRHGETAGNARRVVQTPDTPLSPRGADQARRLARRLADREVGHILASDLTRAAQTAEALRAATGAPFELEPLLRERDFGDVRGTPYAELGFDLFAPGYAPPGGETWEVFHARVDRAWQRIRVAAGATPGHLAVVTHGLFGVSLATRHLRLPEGADPAAGLANTSLTIVEATRPFAVRLYDCTAHLEGGGSAPAGPRTRAPGDAGQ